MTKWTMFVFQIRWIDPNGNGIITESFSNGPDKEKAEQFVIDRFYKIYKTMYGSIDQIEIRQVDGEPVKNGIYNERKWRNPK